MRKTNTHSKTKRTYPWLILLLIPLQIVLCVLIVKLGIWIDGWLNVDPHLPTVIAVLLAIRLFIIVTIFAVTYYKVKKAQKGQSDKSEALESKIPDFKAFDMPIEPAAKQPPVHFFKTETPKPASKEEDYKDIFNAGSPDGFWEKNGME